MKLTFRVYVENWHSMDILVLLWFVALSMLVERAFCSIDLIRIDQTNNSVHRGKLSREKERYPNDYCKCVLARIEYQV